MENRSWLSYILIFGTLGVVVFALSYVGTTLYFGRKTDEGNTSETDSVSQNLVNESDIRQSLESKHVAMTWNEARTGEHVFRLTGSKAGEPEQIGQAVRIEFVIDGDASRKRYTVDFLPLVDYGMPTTYSITFHSTVPERPVEVEEADAPRLREVLRAVSKFQLRLLMHPAVKNDPMQF